MRVGYRPPLILVPQKSAAAYAILLVPINVNGQDINFKASLLFCCGDTPASAKIGGFKESVSAYRPCRTCFTTQNEWKTDFKESNFDLRNKESHEQYVDTVSEPNISKHVLNYWQRRYGVNSKSLLSEIPFFDVTKCLPQDIMHVLIEGVVSIEIKMLLRRCVFELGLFSLYQLNKVVESFDFKLFSADKPGLIEDEHLRDDGNLRQTASQMITLAHCLPFLISEWIYEFEEEIEAYILCHTRLLQILNTCMAYEIHELTINFLSRMIEMFIIDFNNLYPNTIVPKFHFIVHVPYYIRLFGPPRQQWCFRFEAAHQFFKSLIPVVRNFKNITYTLAYRHQARLCSRLVNIPGSSGTKFLYRGDDVAYANTVLLSNLPTCELLIDVLEGIADPNIEIIRSSKIKRFGTSYEPQSVILLHCDEDLLPAFGIIKEIFVVEHQIVLVYKNVATQHYCERFNAYSIKESAHEPEKAIKLENLIFQHPLPTFKANNEIFVILLNHERNEFYG